MTRPARLPEIDWTKGLAIIGVLLIHSAPLEGTKIHVHLIDRAVPVFITLFGTTSELWWQRERGSWAARTRRWYETRLLRLLIPLWGAMAVLWTFRVLAGAETPGATRVALTFMGYLAWIGTGWFVTLVIELVLLFPFLHRILDFTGTTLALILAGIMLAVSQLHILDVINAMRMLLHSQTEHPGLRVYYYFWIFPPTRLFSVIAGVIIARKGGRVGWRAAAIAACLVVLGSAIQDTFEPGSTPEQLIAAFLTVPLTVALLGGVRIFENLPRAARVLAWCGQHSWGLYLGQLVLHESVYLFIAPGGSRRILGRWAYFACLLLGSVFLVHLGEHTRRGLALAARRGLARAGD